MSTRTCPQFQGQRAGAVACEAPGREDVREQVCSLLAPKILTPNDPRGLQETGAQDGGTHIPVEEQQPCWIPGGRASSV